MNPPYGREIEKWMKKAYGAACGGVRVVALIPNRSNAPWWHEYVMKAKEIRFVKHKVSFEGEAEGVPFWGSVIVVFGPWVHYGAPIVSTYMQPKHEVTA
jgi:site-specific DNA-methyltransferase (adenine-specific)